MWWIARRLGWWLGLCVAITASLKLLLVAQIPPQATLAPPHLHAPSHPTQPPHRVYLKGEVYAVRDSEYHRMNHRTRPGLVPLLRPLYTQLTIVRAQYATPSSHLSSLIERLKRDLTRRGVTDDPWDLARKWASPRSLVPKEARGLGDILAALSTAPIISADVGYKGTQLKMSLRLKGGQRIVFKPQWYGRGEVVEGEVYAGADRHNGEVAAFHLSRLVGLATVPLTVGRRISLKRHILPVATKKLADTFFTRRGDRMCFYGVCYYCHKDASVCDNGHSLEGSATLWLPSRLPLMHHPNPWARTYKRTNLTQWEKDPRYCEYVLRVNPYGDPSSPRLLDLMDATVLDFLIQNGDRHHYTVVAGNPRSSLILLDNGKSFGDSAVDHMDILAPLLQCCRKGGAAVPWVVAAVFPAAWIWSPLWCVRHHGPSPPPSSGGGAGGVGGSNSGGGSDVCDGLLHHLCPEYQGLELLLHHQHRTSLRRVARCHQSMVLRQVWRV